MTLLMWCLLSQTEQVPECSNVLRNLEVPHLLSQREELNNPTFLLLLEQQKIDLIVLAGFFLKIPTYLIAAFSDRIINIHPALLPKYGGKGMYGDQVHKSVLLNKERQSGITIHLVNEHYDEGKILFQKSCEVMTDDESQGFGRKNSST